MAVIRLGFWAFWSSNHHFECSIRHYGGYYNWINCWSYNFYLT